MSLGRNNYQVLQKRVLQYVVVGKKNFPPTSHKTRQALGLQGPSPPLAPCSSPAFYDGLPAE